MTDGKQEDEFGADDLYILTSIYAKLKSPDKKERAKERHLKICEVLKKRDCSDTEIKAFTYLRMCPILAKITQNAIKVINDGEQSTLDVILSDDLQICQFVHKKIKEPTLSDEKQKVSGISVLLDISRKVCTFCKKDKRFAKLFDKDDLFVYDKKSEITENHISFKSDMFELKQIAKNQQKENNEEIIRIDRNDISPLRAQNNKDSKSIDYYYKKIEELQDDIAARDNKIENFEAQVQDFKDKNNSLGMFIKGI